MRKGNYRFRRPRCCGSMMVSAYIRHGKTAPGIEKTGLYCPRCKRFEIERPIQPAFIEFVRIFPILKHVDNVLKPYMNTVRGLYFHGSSARGDHRKDSDYDLVLITRDKIDNELKIELKFEPDDVIKARVIHSAILRLRQAYIRSSGCIITMYLNFLWNSGNILMIILRSSMNYTGL